MELMWIKIAFSTVQVSINNICSFSFIKYVNLVNNVPNILQYSFIYVNSFLKVFIKTTSYIKYFLIREGLNLSAV